MQIQTLVGPIGVMCGAVIGAGGALLGGWLQQSRQAKTAKEQRREERRYAAGQAALEMLIRFRLASMERTDEPESVLAFAKAFVEFATTFDAALYVVSDAEEMRTRVLNTMSFSAYTIELGHTHDEAKTWIDPICREAIGVLSAFLREEPLPEPSQGFLDRCEIVRAHKRAQGAPS